MSTNKTEKNPKAISAIFAYHGQLYEGSFGNESRKKKDFFTIFRWDKLTSREISSLIKANKESQIREITSKVKKITSHQEQMGLHENTVLYC